MATKTSNPSNLTRVEEEKKQPQTSRVQDKRTNTTNAHEVQPLQPLCNKEVDGIPSASSPTNSISKSPDAGERLPQNVDFIDSLDESEATERLDQLAHILDVIDPVVDHGYNESSKELDPDAIKPHIEEEDNEETSSIAQTDHDSAFLKCRGGLADSASQFSGEDCRGDKASQHEGNGNEGSEESDLVHFLEHAPESHLSDEARENERDEHPWRTWSEESTLFEASSVHEGRTSLFSLEAQPSDSLSRISIDCGDEDEDTHENSCEAALITDRSGGYDIPTCESGPVARSRWEELLALASRVEAEDVQPDPRALLFGAETRCDERSAAEDQESESELPNYWQAVYGSSSAELLPPPLPYNRTDLLTRPPTPTSAPTTPSPEPTPPQNTLQTRTDPPAHNLQTLALVGEASLQSPPTEVLAVLGAFEVVGRVVLGEVVDFLVRPPEE
ncbi:MAG: hypothetical protein L6R36_005527 [Xanthoria steineri]|nr:MAG: hypothetical protein L6R36_005527 [Xanthoria steineri]